MKILLIGEYSNVHWTLAEGLRTRGHEVLVVSNGDFFKNYPRDIDLTRSYTKAGGIKYAMRLAAILPKLRGFDVVQIINPMFLELKAEHIKPIYKYLRHHNNIMVLGAFGMDYYWVNTCISEKPLRYSDFNLGASLRTNTDAIRETKDWIGTAKEQLNRHIATDCDAIVTGLYEYHVCYQPNFPDKTTFIPYPIANTQHPTHNTQHPKDRKIRLFIGINSKRSEYKGTDILLRAAQTIASRYPDRVELRVAENVPFSQYVQLMQGSDAILDQLYSYTPSMNPLQAMSQGIICIGGGEPENYEILGEDSLRPIINVLPDYNKVCETLEDFILHPERIPELQQQSMLYIHKHHDHIKVAQQYETLYQKLLTKHKD